MDTHQGHAEEQYVLDLELIAPRMDIPLSRSKKLAAIFAAFDRDADGVLSEVRYDQNLCLR